MIISHKYKYIYFRARKCASTSIELNLRKYVDSGDIYTSIHGSTTNDSYEYNTKSSNTYKYYEHTPPIEVKNTIDPEIWNTYFKFTSVRNPLDRIVSSYKYRKEINTNRVSVLKVLKLPLNLLFKKIIRRFVTNSGMSLYDYIEFMKKYDYEKITNLQFYFIDNKPACNFYIRYENINNDYKYVCNKIGIPYEKLHKTKNKLRNHSKHYSEYYDENTKQLVYDLCKKTINYFGYTYDII